MREPHRIPTARDLMTTHLLTLHPEDSLLSAMQALLKRGYLAI